jgi:glycosyltransferase involved in cell wall biosynthesis
MTALQRGRRPFNPEAKSLKAELTRPMRIALVYDLIFPYSKGGVERRVAEMARRLVQRGHQVTVYGTKMWSESSTKWVDGVLMLGIDVTAPISTRSGRRSIWQGLLFAVRCARSISRREYDIVDLQSMAPLTCLAVIAVCRTRRIPCVITWHEVWLDYWSEYLGPLGRIGRAAEWLVARLGSSHIAVSQRTAARLAQLGTHDVDVVPNGVDASVFRADPAAGAMGGITYVGRLAPHKNLGLLMEAVRALAARGLKPPVTLIGDGPLLDDLTQYASEFENVEVVTCLSDEAALADQLASSRVFALTSSREGFGLAALEALSCGVPVVTMDFPDNAAADLVKDERNGLVCPPTADAMAGALQRILTDDQLHERLSRGAVRSAREYDWDSATAMSELAYQGLLTHGTKWFSRRPKTRRRSA